VQGLPKRTLVKVGSSSGGEPSQRRGHLLPLSLFVARSDWLIPSPGVLSRGASVTILVAAIEALRKGGKERSRCDAGRGGPSEDRAQRYGSFPSHLASRRFLAFSFDASRPCRCRVKKGGLSLDGVASWDLGGGREAMNPA
jgi:hypothetical protein